MILMSYANKLPESIYMAFPLGNPGILGGAFTDPRLANSSPRKIYSFIQSILVNERFGSVLACFGFHI